MANQSNTPTAYEVIADFKAAMAENGIVTDTPIIADGQLHRIHIEGHKSGSLNGAYVLHLDGNPAGYFEDFTAGIKTNWKLEGKPTDDNPIKEAVAKAEKPKVVSINDRAKTKQNSNPHDVVTWESDRREFQVINGAFFQVKDTRDGTTKFPLGNFTFEIHEEITYEDGLNDKAFFRISGKRQDGLQLPMVDVPLAKLNMGNWITEAWGSRAIVYLGNTKKDNLRVCGLLYSTHNGDIPRQHIYGMTGWKKINEQWHYLTGSGAITADGLSANVQVDLGSGHMSKYSLPTIN